MGSTFFGLDIAAKGLQAQQTALNVTAHNVANANTQGYTRQDIIMEASPAVKVLAGYVGTGVDITEFRRIRDAFLDVQMRTENKNLGEWEVKNDILGKLEVIFSESSDTSLSSAMDQYWQAWQKLSNNPESSAVRTNVKQAGITVVNTLNNMNSQFYDLQIDINKGIELKVNEINSTTRQIRDLNEQIIKAEGTGCKANDLRDKRDLLLEQLSKLISIDVTEDREGAVNVTAGGKNLLTRATLTELKFTDNPADPTQAGLEWIDPATGISQGDARITGGTLKGYLDSRDIVIPFYQNNLNTLTKSIASEVNQVHRQGYGIDAAYTHNIDFFTKISPADDYSAKNIQVNQDIINDINKIAAALEYDAAAVAPAPPVMKGDGANALDLAQLKNKLTMNANIATFDDYYRSTIGQLGVQAQEAQNMVDGRALLIEQIENKRESVSGVSLDEEMTNMIKFEHAYSAAARVINAMDEMLDLIVNRLGLAGR